MTIPNINIIEVNTYSELKQQEDQIIGRLFRSILSFEGEVDNEKTWRQVDMQIEWARRDCEMIGSDGTILEAFIKRLNLSTRNRIYKF